MDFDRLSVKDAGPVSPSALLPASAFSKNALPAANSNRVQPSADSIKCCLPSHRDGRAVTKCRAGIPGFPENEARARTEGSIMNEIETLELVRLARDGNREANQFERFNLIHD